MTHDQILIALFFDEQKLFKLIGKIFMKLFVFAILLLSTTSAFAGVREEIARCGNNAVCVGNVVVDYIDQVSPNDRRTVRFYNVSNCSGNPSELVQLTGDFDRDIARCQTLSNESPFGLWYTINGGACIARVVFGQSPQALCKTLL